MNVIKYDPFRELRGLQNEMNRIFSGVGRSVGSEEEITGGSWAPSVDIYEDKDRMVLEADLPGLKREDVEIAFENNVLTLRGERKFEKRDNTDGYHRVERSYGSFLRSFALPQTVTAEGATADLEDGTLRITLPKREESKARKIEVNGAAAAVANA